MKKERELFHHGILGQKWGVRRYQNYDGTLIKKGTEVGRVSLTKEDPTYDNKKYVSINEEDHKKWSDYLGNAYIERNRATYDIAYKTIKDLKVMSSYKQGEVYVDMITKNKDFAKQRIIDLENPTFKALNKGHTSNDKNANEISVMIAAQTKTGRYFCNKVLGLGYDALYDQHGTNVSDNPIIVLDPDKNLKRIEGATYTKEVQDYLRKLGYM